MDILEKRYPSLGLVKVNSILKFQNNKIELVGSAGLKSQIFAGDYDFVCKVLNKENKSNLYDGFKTIFDSIGKEQNLYFIEFKFQNKDESKHKLFSISDFNKQTFTKYFNVKKISFCKIDLVINVNNMNDFCEISCIYFFNDDINVKQYIISIQQDQFNYYKNKIFYKSLKRLMIVAKSQENFKLINLLTKLFNSDTGKLYQLKSKIGAVILLLEKYPKSEEIRKRAELFLSNNGLKGVRLSDLLKLCEEYDTVINGNAKDFIDKNNLDVYYK